MGPARGADTQCPECPGAAVTQHHKLGGSKPWKCIVSQPEGQSPVKVSPSPEAPEEMSSCLSRPQVRAVLLSGQGSSSPCLHVIFLLPVYVSVSKFPLSMKTLAMTTSVTTLLPNKVTFTGTGVRTGAYLLGTQFSP